MTEWEYDQLDDYDKYEALKEDYACLEDILFELDPNYLEGCELV